MLKEINNMEIFFEDCYREISVREYSKIIKVSPPSASKILKKYEKQGLLIQRNERGFLFFRINKDSKLMQNLSRVYWENKLFDLLNFLEKKTMPIAIVLFGSLSKLEARKDSDIDLAVLSKIIKEMDLSKFEKEIGRKIQIFFYESLNKINNELKLNIINGYILRGYLS